MFRFPAGFTRILHQFFGIEEGSWRADTDPKGKPARADRYRVRDKKKSVAAPKSRAEMTHTKFRFDPLAPSIARKQVAMSVRLHSFIETIHSI
jgi:hypothetical protein